MKTKLKFILPYFIFIFCVVGAIILTYKAIKEGNELKSQIQKDAALAKSVEGLRFIEFKKFKDQQQIDIYNANYNSCLLYLMYSEDILLKPNSELTGQSLIYFGHAVKKGETFNNPNYRKAYDLLQIDFCKCIDIAISKGFNKENNQQLAVALMFYNMRPESVNKILEDSLININKFIYYSKIENGIEYQCKSKNLENNRRFEKDLYFEDGFINVSNYIYPEPK
jgi:hypothetical protein